MRKLLSNAATLVLVLCALLITGMVGRRAFLDRRASTQRTVQEVEGWGEISRFGHLSGAPDAPVRVVEFSDFQCPFCAAAQEGLAELRRAHPHDVAVVYRHLPLTAIHPHAMDAASAAECAGAQGRFFPFHDVLYQKQDSIGVLGWSAFAEAAGVVDLAEFQQCIREQRFLARIQRDVKAADKLGISGTPTFVVNGRMFSGVLSREEWEKQLRAAKRAAAHPGR